LTQRGGIQIGKLGGISQLDAGSREIRLQFVEPGFGLMRTGVAQEKDFNRIGGEGGNPEAGNTERHGRDDERVTQESCCHVNQVQNKNKIGFSRPR